METEQTQDSILGDITKTQLITAFSTFTLAVFIIALYLTNQADWERKLREAQLQQAANQPQKTVKNSTTITTPSNENTIAVDKALEEAAKEENQETVNNSNASSEALEQLQTDLSEVKRELQQFKVADSVRIKAIQTQASYKIYGLFKDKNGKATEKEVAQKFNIKSEKAIKTAEINGEKAYVVPIKGVHIAKGGDTAFSIAKKYYKNDKAAKLVADFNGEIQAGMIVFLPFEK